MSGWVRRFDSVIPQPDWELGLLLLTKYTELEFRGWYSVNNNNDNDNNQLVIINDIVNVDKHKSRCGGGEEIVKALAELTTDCSLLPSSDMSSSTGAQLPLALCIQPACLEHKYIRHANSSHIFERPERLRAVLLGFAAALSRLESADVRVEAAGGDKDDLASMLSSLSIANGSPFPFPSLVHLLAPPPLPITPGQILLHHPALQLAHSPPEPAPYPYLPNQRNAPIPSSPYLRDLYKWASNAVETIKNTGCEIPDDMGLNPGDLYLGPGSIVAIEGSVSICVTELILDTNCLSSG